MKILMLISNGFEEIEAVTTIDILRRCGIEVHVCSMTGTRDICGSHNIILKSDILFEQIDTEYDGIVLPGGLPNAHTLRDDKRIINIVKQYNKKEKVLAAICAAPCVFSRCGILKDKKATSYPGSIDDNSCIYMKVKTITDGNIVTGNGVGGAIEFALATAYALGKIKETIKVRESILYDWN